MSSSTAANQQQQQETRKHVAVTTKEPADTVDTESTSGMSQSTTTGGATPSQGSSTRSLSGRGLKDPTEELKPTPNKQGVRDMDLESRLQWAGPLGTLDSIIKAQRRIKGVIVSISSEGSTESCRIASEYGEFPFNLAAVKQNKRFPDRQPKARDRCEFKVSQTNPPKATSIRIAIPSSEVAQGEKAPGPKPGSEGGSAAPGPGSSSLVVGPSSGNGALEPVGPPTGSTPMSFSGETGYSFLTGYSASTTGNSIGQSGPTGTSLGGGGTGLDDLCVGLQGMSAFGSREE